MKKIFILLLTLNFALCFWAKSFKLSKSEIIISKSDGTTVSCLAEIAKKPEERNFGFMERKSIPDGTGMLFVFEYEQILSFWMKNTPHPLSIAFIDSKGKIRNIFDMEPYSLSTTDSTVSCRYALEVPKGWFNKNNIKPGDYISLNF